MVHTSEGLVGSGQGPPFCKREELMGGGKSWPKGLSLFPNPLTPLSYQISVIPSFSQFRCFADRAELWEG